MRLSDEQRALVEQNIGLAGYAATKVQTWLDRDEAFSIACLALCRAAYHFKPEKGHFATYASRCCVRAILFEAKYQRRKSLYGQTRPIDDEGQLGYVPVDPVVEIERAEKNIKAYRYLEMAKGRTRLIIELIADGLYQREVSEKLGLHRDTVARVLFRFRERFKRQ